MLKKSCRAKNGKTIHKNIMANEFCIGLIPQLNKLTVYTANTLFLSRSSVVPFVLRLFARAQMTGFATLEHVKHMQLQNVRALVEMIF